MFTCPGSAALLVKGCWNRIMLIGKAGSSGAGRFELKGLCEHVMEYVPVAFHSLPSASSFEIGRLRSGFNHGSHPSQYGIIRKLDPV